MNSKETSQTDAELPNWSFWGTISSALAAQLCCGLPWLLLSLGLSGPWIAQLHALKPIRPIFMLSAVGFLLAGLWQLQQQRRKGCPLPRQR